MVFNILTTTPDIFLNQTYLVRLGIFHLELEKKHTFLALGMGPNFGPKFQRSRALKHRSKSPGRRHDIARKFWASVIPDLPGMSVLGKKSNERQDA